MTLTQTASITRKVILVIIILAVLGISGTIGYNIWHQHYLASLPPVEEKPEMKFGTLPEPIFLPSNVSSSNFSYSLDTVTGGLPQTPKLIKVYFIPQAGLSLLAPEKSQRLAQILGFPNPPQVISPTNYFFADDNNGELKVDLMNGNFHFRKAEPKKGKSLPDQNELTALFRNYLSARGLLPEELRGGRSQAIFDNTSPADSQTATVSLWPADFADLPIVTAAFNRGLVRGTFTKPAGEEGQFISIDYTFWVIDQTTFSTYPLKTANQALEELHSGQGFISLESGQPQVSISSVYLAYFEPEEYSPYLQPVFVFEGPGFAALVPAIVSEGVDLGTTLPTQN